MLLICSVEGYQWSSHTQGARSGFHWLVCIYLSVCHCSLCECSLCISSLLAFSIDTLALVNSATWKVNLCLIKNHAMITLALDGVELSSSHPCHVSPKERVTINHWIGGLVIYRTGLDALGMRKTHYFCVKSKYDPTVILPVSLSLYWLGFQLPYTFVIST